MSEETQDNKPEQFKRFRDIVPIERLEELRVTIIGAGGIGAPTALSLAKTGVKKLRVYDFDKVETHNTGPQLYGPKDVGAPKVVALRRMLNRMAPWCELDVQPERYEGQEHDVDVLIAAVDSLEVRREIWGHMARLENPEHRPALLVDPRMGAEVLTVYSVEVDNDGEWYEPTLEGEAVEATCTAKATFYTGLIAGGMAAQAVKQWIVEERTLAETTLDLRYLTMLGMDFDHMRESAAAQKKAAS